MSQDVVVNLVPLKEFRGVVQSDLAGATNGPVRRAFKQWGYRYRTWAQQRFDAYSKGGGDWPPLKTKRKRGELAAASILRDTNTLFTALDPTFSNKPGQLEEKIPFGIRVGFGGPHRHPSGTATIADIAMFHDQGMGNNPQRQIIVDPPVQVVLQMARDMERGLATLVKEKNAGH